MTAEAAHDDTLVARARVALARATVVFADRVNDADRLIHEAEAAVARLGGDVELESNLLDTRASVEEARGHYSQSRALLEQRIALLRGAGQLATLEMGHAENNLGALLAGMAPADALPHFDAALAIEIPLLGAHHPTVLLAKSNRVLALANSGAGPRDQIAAAQALLAEVEAATNSPDNQFLAQVLKSYAAALFSDPLRRPEAPAIMLRALSLFAALFPPEHIEVGSAEGQAANMLLETGRFAEAEQHSRTFLEFVSRRPSDNHDWWRQGLMMHGRALLGLHRAPEARADLERAVSLRDATTLFSARDLAREQFALACALDATGEPARAVQLARAAEAGFLKQPIEDDERLASVRAWLATHPPHKP